MIIIQASVCLIVIVILANFICKRKNKRFYQLLNQFPSYPSYPLIGNAYMMMGSLEGLLRRFEKLVQPYDRLAFWLGPVPCLILKKHNDIATILNQCQHRDSYELVDAWLGLGILSATYEDWKISRRLLAPAFNSDMLSKYAKVFERNASDLIEELKPIAEAGKQIDVFPLMKMTNIDAIGKTVLGVGIQGKQGEEFCHAVFEGFKHGARRVQMPFLIPRILNTIYLKTSGKIKHIDHIKRLPAETIKKKMKLYQDFQHRNNATDKDDVTMSQSVIDIIIQNHMKVRGLTETRMRDEVLQLMIPAIKALAYTTSFLMLMFALNQDVQQKAYEEVIQLTTDDETLFETHNRLEYLEQCVKETMRMFNAVGITTRRTHKEISLNDNTIIPKNIFVAVMMHFSNYDPEMYKNPQKWDPEHFNSETVKQRPKTAQLSFGYGPRSCIGNKYAMMSIKIQIAYILRHYHLSTSVKEFTKHHLIIDLAVKSTIGYPIRFTRRSAKSDMELN